jgi:hypothetical protein
VKSSSSYQKRVTESASSYEDRAVPALTVRHGAPINPAPVAQAPPPAQHPAKSGVDQISDVINILLNLPRRLNQTTVRAAGP